MSASTFTRLANRSYLSSGYLHVVFSCIYRTLAPREHELVHQPYANTSCCEFRVTRPSILHFNFFYRLTCKRNECMNYSLYCRLPYRISQVQHHIPCPSVVDAARLDALTALPHFHIVAVWPEKRVSIFNPERIKVNAYIAIPRRFKSVGQVAYHSD